MADYDSKAARRILNHCRPKLTEPKIQEKLRLLEAEITRQMEYGHTDRDCLINDAVYGPVELTRLMYIIINTSEFHRLRNIKQLGATHYVYPCANHTRFDHSIGVYYLAGEFARHLKQQLSKDEHTVKDDGEFQPYWKFEDKEIICIQVAALCHDLGQGPYSHMFEENVLQKLDLKITCDELSIKIFRRMLVENPKVLFEFVREGLDENHVQMIEWMIKKPSIRVLPVELRKRAFLFEIVYNKATGVDVNTWDYYARDCHSLGVRSDFQWRRCMHLGRILKCTARGENDPALHIAFSDKQLDDIYGMYRTGVLLHQRAHQHKTIKAVEKMISDALMEIHSCLKLIHGRDGTAKTIREAIEEAKNDNLDWYLALTDSIIEIIKWADHKSIEALLESDKESLRKAKHLLKRVEERDLYHMADKIRIPKMYSMLNGDAHLREKNAVYAAAVDTQRQASNEAIYCLLDDAGDTNYKQEIAKDDLWVTLVSFQFPPDRIEGVEEGNPAENVLFYKKHVMNTDAVLLEPVDIKASSSFLVTPQAFVECELRVYDTRPADKRKKEHQKALKDALQLWKRKTEKLAAENYAIAK